MKRAHTDGGADGGVPPHALETLSTFTAIEVINDGRDAGRQVVVRGAFEGCEEEALVKISRAALPSTLEGVGRLFARTRLRTRAPYSGAEYGYFHGTFDGAESEEAYEAEANVDVLYPGCLTTTPKEAREKLLAKHIARSSTQRLIAVRETPEMYRAAHEEYISGIPEQAISWVYKILNLEKEKERLLHVDEEFLLNTDPKWTTHPDCAETARETWRGHPSTTDLYCLGLCVRRDVRSIRDLRSEHLPMLRRMLEKGREVIEEVYGVKPEECRVFVHYPPQFYHFHVHYQALSALEMGCQTERAHLLEDVIDNIERDSDFYAKASLTVKMGERDKLYALYATEHVGRSS